MLGWCTAVPTPPQLQKTVAEAAGTTETTLNETKGVSGHPKITYSKETVTKVGARVKLDCAVEGVDLTGVNDFSVSWSKVRVC